MRLLFSLLFCFTLFSFSSAQVEYVERLELELKDDYEGEEIYEFGDNGFLLLAQSEDKSRGKREWKIDHYDTDLQLVESKKFEVHKRYQVDSYSKQDDEIQILLNRGRGKIGVLSISLRTGSVEIDITEVKIPKKLMIDFILSSGDITFLSGSTFKMFGGSEHVIAQIDNRKATVTLEPVRIVGAKQKFLDVESFFRDEITGNITCHITQINKSEKRVLSHFIVYDESGEKLDKFEVSDNSGKSITSLSSTQFSDSERMITGTYSEKWRSSSMGLFFGKMKGQDIDFIEYYPFTDLDNFLNYLPEKKQERLERRKKRKKRKGKDFNLSYLMASHGVINVDDGQKGYIYIGEAYYPTYRTETYTTTDSNGNTITQTRTVFDGYQYTHAVIARFDEKGNMLWDHIMELNIARKPFYVKRFIAIAEDKQDGVKMTYSSDFKIHVKKISFDGEILLDQESEEIDFGQGDKLKRATADITFWYDNFFLAYGTQKIKDGGVFNKRKVFFMSKIKVD